ncbi:hypothetical protein E9998_00115 [Glycomyces paridis]|uniref:Lipoprotein n=1 Tax=Glycomyces paridis TaxID=2126555 RepID=A0A4S8PN21_9ACTN|nr:hypothetical protein E9998_00115 [Glycomyces paridis]
MGLPLACLALAGCSAASSLVCADARAERGEAGASVAVEDVEGPTGATATVTDWRIEPHPQTPDEGDLLHFEYEVTGFEGTRLHLDVCAVDADRTALVCVTVMTETAWEQTEGVYTGDEWLFPEDLGRVADVLIVPNDVTDDRAMCDQDAKDGGGTHPPEGPVPGERL